jgi:enoyl-CoA hydratase
VSDRYETLLYDTDARIATITLNRPDALNTIVPPMTDELEDAVNRAVLDREIRVIVLRGAGRSFSGGFDFGGGFHHWDDRIATEGEVHEPVELAEAGDRAGAQLGGRRRQRDGALQ